MDSFGGLLPHLVTPVPGPASRALGDRLRAVESRNVTFIGDDFPVFWDEARGANVRDADGNVFLDLTAAFGVALVGHGSAGVVSALRDQAERLIHGMGDVHPPTAKVRLLEALAALLPWPDTRIVLGSSGSEAVEAALKTARLASGRPGIVALAGGYHGLTVGSLAVTARPEFRAPVVERVYGGVVHLPFPIDGRPACVGEASSTEVLAELDRALTDGRIGTVIVEPVQARGGVRVLPAAFSAGLMERVRAHDLVLVADEIYTGLGRCGAVLASPLVGLEPDIVCLGKVLGGGMPLSACAAPARIMDAWPLSTGEALHTSTFLGHPLSCAAALHVLERVAAGLGDEARAVGQRLLGGLEEALHPTASPAREGRAFAEIRGLGLLLGVEIREADGSARAGAGARIASRLLTRGVLALPAGEVGSVIELSPPVVLTAAQERCAVELVVWAIREELAR